MCLFKIECQQYGRKHGEALAYLEMQRMRESTSDEYLAGTGRIQPHFG